MLSTPSIKIVSAAFAICLLAACSSAPPTLPIAPVPEATATPTPLEPVAVSSPTDIPTPQVTTQPPAVFSSGILRADVYPMQYIQDACTYTKLRWNPSGALPGTVVAPIMFHSVLQGDGTNSDASAINETILAEIVQEAQDLGFETITTQQLLAFLKENAKIPARSMIMILDDRRPGTAEDNFLPYLKQNKWTLTLAWIAQADTDQRKGRLSGETLWDWIERLNNSGYFDIQSHGLNHLYLTDGMDEETVQNEVAGSIPVLQQHFGITALAYIWPGGNFTQLGLDVARQAGFQLGFTERSHGPLQFNWIPLTDHEIPYNDPIMLMPRFWDTAAVLNLKQTAQIGDAAQAFAKDHYADEADWYQQNCGDELPPLQDVFK